MYVNQPLRYTAEDRGLEEAPPEVAQWGTACEPMLPARNVAWTTIALIVVTLLVLAFA